MSPFCIEDELSLRKCDTAPDGLLCLSSFQPSWMAASSCVPFTPNKPKCHILVLVLFKSHSLCLEDSSPPLTPLFFIENSAVSLGLFFCEVFTSSFQCGGVQCPQAPDNQEHICRWTGWVYYAFQGETWGISGRVRKNLLWALGFGWVI